MQDINRIVIIGRLTKDLGSDPNGRDFGYLQNGTCKAIVSIAVNRSKKQGDQWVEEVSYFDVEIWGNTAQNLKPYLVRGQQISVDGSLVQDRWEKDGQKQSRIYIRAENVQLVGGSKREDNGQQSQFAQQYQQQQGRPQFTQQTVYRSETPVEQPAQQTFGGNDFPEDIHF